MVSRGGGDKTSDDHGLSNDIPSDTETWDFARYPGWLGAWFEAKMLTRFETWDFARYPGWLGAWFELET